MSLVTESIEIKATPQQCYDVITAYENYPEFLTEIKQATVSGKSKAGATVTYSLELIKKISYTLKMAHKSPKSVTWQLIKGDLMKKNEGEWLLAEIKKGWTRATYKIDIDLGLFVPSMISKRLVGSSLPAMMQAFKKRIEEKD